MSTVDRFMEVVDSICKRRSLYVCGGTFYEVCAYLAGYAAASPDCLLGGEGWSAFNAFVCAAQRFPGKYYWPFVLKESSRDDGEAVARLQDLLTEFAERTKTESLEDIVRDVTTRARAQEETEPVRAYRKFSRAIHRGIREEVEPLIQDHPDAGVLWSGRYLNDVAPLLDRIEESYVISIIRGSEDEGEVTIITPNAGPVGVKRIDGKWRIDASRFIDRWKAIREQANQ